MAHSDVVSRRILPVDCRIFDSLRSSRRKHLSSEAIQSVQRIIVRRPPCYPLSRTYRTHISSVDFVQISMANYSLQRLPFARCNFQMDSALHTPTTF